MLNYSNELQAKNIFLSGKRNSGKTTIIKKLAAELNLSVSGFMVGRDIDREEWTSFYLLPALVFLFFSSPLHVLFNWPNSFFSIDKGFQTWSQNIRISLLFKVLSSASPSRCFVRPTGTVPIDNNSG